MRNAAIFHGTAGSPKHFWHPYVKRELEKMGFNVWVPQLPDAEKPDITKWLPYALDGIDYNSDTVLIGHSAGCPLILSILENIKVRISLAILVAAFFEPLDNIHKEAILQDSYDWERITNNCARTVIINSDNDPWGCNEKIGMRLFHKIGGDIIIRHGEGHMGSEKYNQPYKEYPLVVNLVRAFVKEE